MDLTSITDAIRRGIREPSPRDVSDTDISAVVIRGVIYLGLKIKEIAPSFFFTRKSLQSPGNMFRFAWPDDCQSIVKVWDLGDNAIAISGAADNGSGLIRITTSAAHGFSDGAIVRVHDVGGTTEANEVWKIDYDTSTHATTEFDLLGSEFSNTYSSGGYCYVEPADPIEIKLKNVADADMSSPDRWYPRGKNIIVDDSGFTNDVIVMYDTIPDAIADIPTEYHEYLVSFGIIDLMRVPSPDDTDYYDKTKTIGFHQSRIPKLEADIARTLKPSSEPQFVRHVMRINE